MADEQQVAGTTVDDGDLKDKPPIGESKTQQNGSGVEQHLKALLNEWDGKASKALAQPPEDAEIVPRDLEEIAEFEKRIKSLEDESNTIKSENSELTERVEQSEKMAELVEEQALKNDQHDHAALVKRLASEVGITERVAKMELKKFFEENENLLVVADNRAENPDEFDAVIKGLIPNLQDKHPQRENNRHLGHAVRIARSAHDMSAIYGGDDSYGNFQTMSDQEFAVQRDKVFADMRTGKLKWEGSSRGGFCLSTSPL